MLLVVAAVVRLEHRTALAGEVVGEAQPRGDVPPTDDVVLAGHFAARAEEQRHRGVHVRVHVGDLAETAERGVTGPAGNVVGAQVAHPLASVTDTGADREPVVDGPDVLGVEVQVGVPVVVEVREAVELDLVHVLGPGRVQRAVVQVADGARVGVPAELLLVDLPGPAELEVVAAGLGRQVVVETGRSCAAFQRLNVNGRQPAPDHWPVPVSIRGGFVAGSTAGVIGQPKPQWFTWMLL